MERPDAVVLGATGFIGRWLLLELLGQGRPVAAVLRDASPARADRLRTWIREHGGDAAGLTVVAGDITADGLGLSDADDSRLGSVRDVFNAAGLYRFGLGREEARTANVDGALAAARWAATRQDLRRVVHVSGYRVGSDATARYPLPAAELEKLYRVRGAYEASKTEGDAAVRVLAEREALPLTVVNPSVVIGHSVTGESGQYIGLADLVRNLWTGRLPALAGTARTFVPVVTVDHLARFMAAVPDHDPKPGGAHWVLDEDTPYLRDLVRLLADHLGVRAPRRMVPVGLVRRLPSRLTGVAPETLTFLSEDRYDTRSAQRVAEAAGLRKPPIEPALRRWADRLVAERFGAPTIRPK